jgi:hypothetical protein
MDSMTSAILVLCGIFLLAFLVWARARRQILNGAHPDGRVVYQGTDRRLDLERPLVSQRYGLTGKPDYLVETANGLTPVELKSRDSARSRPYAMRVTPLS